MTDKFTINVTNPDGLDASDNPILHDVGAAHVTLSRIRDAVAGLTKNTTIQIPVAVSLLSLGIHPDDQLIVMSPCATVAEARVVAARLMYACAALENMIDAGQFDV